MSLRLSSLGGWSGTINRGPYFLAGISLLVLKFGLDWLVANVIFDRPWTLANYLAAPAQAARVFALDQPDRLFFGTLLVLALPFIWVGIALTVRRLRATGLPIFLVALFFLPVVNLFFFVALSVLPTRQPPMALDITPGLSGIMGPERFAHFRAAHRRITRGNSAPSAAVALVISVPLALGFILLSVSWLQNYGWGLFVGTPFCLGMGSVLLYGISEPQSFGRCMGLAFSAAGLVGLCMLGFAMEGMICLLMAAPIGFFLVFLGALVGYVIQARPWTSRESPLLMLALVLTLPAMMGAETSIDLEPPLLEVRTSIDIDAPAEKVWRYVLAFPPLPEPDDWLFQAGVAYPTCAEIRGQGPGAVRHCVFSTGTFVEPIEVWEEPTLLRFRVTDQPEPLREWSPFDIHPPHLDHYLVSRRGQFLLVALPGGRTRLEGTTWYTNRMWPAGYWQWWSDYTIQRIHRRVLEHIKKQATN
jgi:uncharacterized membrane protein YhaH (DUF805 family)